MTPDKIQTRNRVNAQNSTGPRTAAGKAVVAQNARRHGATAAPKREDVAIWLRIILGDPDLGMEALLESDPSLRCALDLAKAEVGLLAAKQALSDFEAAEPEPNSVIEELESEVGNVAYEIAYENYSEKDIEQLWRFAERFKKMIAQEKKRDEVNHSRRHRLVKRYFREAHSRRTKAFAAWIAWNMASGKGGAASP